MGGAKNCPETPRQKMIGMMYLVLTAMLALNVSTDILNGFTMVDDSLFSTIAATEDRNANMYSIFEQQKNDKPEKYAAPYEQAMEMRRRSDSLFNYISNFKREMAVLVVGEEEANKHNYATGYAVRGLKGTSNLDVTGQYGLVQGNGIILKQNIEAYRDYLLSILDASNTPSDPEVRKMRDQFQMLFSCDSLMNQHEGKMDTWENGMFEGMVLNATITVLSKIQNDIRATEGQMIQHLMGSADALDLRVNKLQAYVIPKSERVTRGTKYQAQIILAAIDSTQRPEYYVEGQKINEHGLYEVVASGEGVRKYKGQIAILSNTGEMQYLPFESEYTVINPTATISNTELNVLYRGYDNKLKISADGHNLRIEATNATVSQHGDLWYVKPNESAKQVKVTVTADMDGKRQVMGDNTYRVKTLPNPSAFFVAGGNSMLEGAVTKKAATANDAIVEASYGEDGILDIDFKITTFTISTGSKLATSTSASLTAEQKKMINSLRSGEQFSINSIRAIGPDGKEKRLNSISLSIK